MQISDPILFKSNEVYYIYLLETFEGITNLAVTIIICYFYSNTYIIKFYFSANTGSYIYTCIIIIIINTV